MLLLVRETSNILSCIPAANIFIEAGIDSGGVLVHCFGGRSRSAAFIAAYLISSYGMDYDDAISTIKRYRPTICINKGKCECAGVCVCVYTVVCVYE